MERHAAHANDKSVSAHYYCMFAHAVDDARPAVLIGPWLCMLIFALISSGNLSSGSLCKISILKYRALSLQLARTSFSAEQLKSRSGGKS